jgi:hypothetical protein
MITLPQALITARSLFLTRQAKALAGTTGWHYRAA